MLYSFKSAALLFLFFLGIGVNAQNQLTTLTSTGSGSSKEIAVQQSLRSAIEQAFGAFISAKTEIINDDLISDEITSVASGNVQNYELLSEVYNPEASSYFVTTKVTLSISKLTDFVQSKGVEVEVKGDLFAANIIQQELNAKSEFEALKNMLLPFHEAMLQAYDFNLSTLEPVLIDKESNKWKIDLKVNATANANFDLAYSILENTLRGVSLKQEEAEEYVKLGKDVYPVVLWNDTKDQSHVGLNQQTKQYEYFSQGTLLTEIAKEYNVEIDSILVIIPALYFKGRGEKRCLRYTVSKRPFESISNVERSQKLIYLRNERSNILLREVIERLLDLVYGSHFDVLSNIHNYYSYPDVSVRLDNSQLQNKAHSIVVKGETSSITSFMPKDMERRDLRFEHHEKFNYVQNLLKDELGSEHVLYGSYSIGGKVFPLGLPGFNEIWDYPTLRFRSSREFDLRDEISFKELARVTGYSVSVSNNVFSFGNGGITIKNGDALLVAPLLSGDGLNCDCDDLKIGAFTDWKIASADAYLQLYEQYYWLFGDKKNDASVLCLRVLEDFRSIDVR